MRLATRFTMLFFLLACPDTNSTTEKAAEGENPGECSDTLDNDSDGVVDCDEEDCAEACAGEANSPPGAPAVSVEPAQPVDSDSLTCLVVTDSSDADGDAVTYRYSWEVNGADAQITSSSVSDVATNPGDTWTCMVTPNDGTEDGTPGTASVTVAGRANTPPGAPVVDVTPDEPTDDDMLHCEIAVEAVDAEGDAITYQYSWEVDGVDAGINDAMIPADMTSPRETWLCTATAYDGTDFGGSDNDFVEIADSGGGGGGGGGTGTGYVVAAWSGTVSGDGRSLTSGEWGRSYYEYNYNQNTWNTNNEICYTYTPLVDAGSAPSCPGCDFTYMADAVTGGSTTAGCADIAAAVPQANYADAYAGYGFGLGATADYQNYGIAAMYLYISTLPDYGFFLFNFDYPPYYELTLNGNDFEWSRIIRDSSSGYPYYYAY